jgi:hypothetical protein
MLFAELVEVMGDALNPELAAVVLEGAADILLGHGALLCVQRHTIGAVVL